MSEFPSFLPWLMTPTKTCPHKPMLAEWTSEFLSLSLSFITDTCVRDSRILRYVATFSFAVHVVSRAVSPLRSSFREVGHMAFVRDPDQGKLRMTSNRPAFILNCKSAPDKCKPTCFA